MQVHLQNIVKLGLCLLALLVLIHQASSSPVRSSRSMPERSDALVRRTRMTPLWRIMGSKPPRAYCHEHMECSTGLCRNGHCSFNEPVHS